MNLIYILFVFLPSCLSIRKQSVGVKGRLLCGNRPMVGTQLKLWDEDSGPDPDDLMSEGITDKDGNFAINGSTVELTNIEPRFKVYHNCNNKWICKRKVAFTIPNKYINHGSKIKKWFHIGTLNMETVFENEERNCWSIFG